MPGLDDLAREIATELMLDAARNVSAAQIKTAAGGHDAVAGLDAADFQRLLDAIANTIDTAEITIDTRGA